MGGVLLCWSGEWMVGIHVLCALSMGTLEMGFKLPVKKPEAEKEEATL
jgi:hypothetical protein